MRNILYCYGDFDFLSSPILIGTLHAEEKRGRTAYSFEYSEQYMDGRYGFSLSPDLPVSSERQHMFGEQLSGMFADASPDRWGRALIRKKLRIQDPGIKFIPEILYLEEVSDETRMGALRFSETEGGPFISVDGEAVPPIADLRKLEAMSMDYERDNLEDAWIMNLARQGSSLGGARPKATVRDTDGTLHIAKFPSVKDEYDVGAMECLVMKLADKVGLSVPSSYKARRFLGEGYHTFISSRFDRTSENRRIHTASAMTLSERHDGEEEGILDLVDVIYTYSADMIADLREMYTRTLFSWKMNNRDNHLRNHSFVLEKDGWHLSPLYDVNISPYGNDFALDLGEGMTEWSLEAILNLSDYFQIDRKEAERLSYEMDQVIRESFFLEAGKLGILPSVAETFFSYLNI